MQAGSALRLVFAGTPEFAVPHLQALLASRHRVCAVFTQPGRPSGRGRKVVPSPVQQVADAAGIPVKQPSSLKQEEIQADLLGLAPDLMVVVAYGLILPPEVLEIPRWGCINVHASLLPRWRGAAPIQRALEAGDSHSGVSIMQMETGLDTGPVLASAVQAIAENTTGGELQRQLMALGPDLLLQVLDDLEACQLGAQRQPEGATYAHKINRVDALLDWNANALSLHRKILAFNPVPTAWTLLAGQPLKVWQAEPCAGSGPAGEILHCSKAGIVAACGEGALRLQRLQLSGGKPLASAELLNARRDQFKPGLLLGAQGPAP
ncbi:MAG: methionyl-tRNA formyltransferase [Halieaceae bacterium]|nr:methionyl-tRNA formyltransferase [Halieaceae bacterium]